MGPQGVHAIRSSSGHDRITSLQAVANGWRIALKLIEWMLIVLIGLSRCPHGARDKILIVLDERPQMQRLADFLLKQGGLRAELVTQENLPNSFSSYKAVVLYLHHQLLEKTEIAAISYVRQGGRLVVLHHSISSGKRANRYWFDFLRIHLPKAPLDQGGYAYRDPVSVQLINLAPDHYITRHHIVWPEQIAYAARGDSLAPAVSLTHTEVYLNHQFTDGDEKTVLCGFKYYDQASGEWFVQERSAWLKRVDEGLVFYFMFGHEKNDFENPLVLQMIMNGITYQH